MRGLRLPSGVAAPLFCPCCAGSEFSLSSRTPRFRDPEGLEAQNSGKRRARVRPRVSAGPGSEGSLERGRGGNRGGARQRDVHVRTRGVGLRARPGRAVTGERRKEGVTPIPPPTPLPLRQPEPGRRWSGLVVAGKGWSRSPRLEEAGLWTPRPSSDFLLRGAPPRTFCGGRGRGAELQQRRGSGCGEGTAPATVESLCRATRRGPEPGASRAGWA